VVSLSFLGRGCGVRATGDHDIGECMAASRRSFALAGRPPGIWIAALCACAVAGCAAFQRFEPTRAEVQFSDDGVPEGNYRLYSARGRLQAIGQFEQGQRTGVWTFWDSGGIKILELTYVRGVKEGSCQMWFGSFAYPWAAGTMKLEANFSSDQEDGTKWTWSPDGGLRCETKLTNGAVVDAQCWKQSGEALTKEEALDAARDELKADIKYLRTVDEVVNDSVRERFTAREPTSKPLPPEKLRQ
jgi:hypothetical protein